MDNDVDKEACSFTRGERNQSDGGQIEQPLLRSIADAHETIDLERPSAPQLSKGRLRRHVCIMSAEPVRIGVATSQSSSYHTSNDVLPPHPCPFRSCPAARSRSLLCRPSRVPSKGYGSFICFQRRMRIGRSPFESSNVAGFFRSREPTGANPAAADPTQGPSPRPRSTVRNRSPRTRKGCGVTIERPCESDGGGRGKDTVESHQLQGRDSDPPFSTPRSWCTWIVWSGDVVWQFDGSDSDGKPHLRVDRDRRRT